MIPSDCLVISLSFYIVFMIHALYPSSSVITIKLFPYDFKIAFSNIKHDTL